MGNDNKMFKGMLLGALVGAAVTLLDKRTRDDVVQYGQRATTKIKGYLDEPTTFTDEIKGKIQGVKDTIHEVSEDITFLNDKYHELKETTPQVVNLLQETKDRFISKRD